MKYIYQRDGGPLLRWANSAPRQTRAADATALGSLGGHTLGGHTLKEPTIGGSLQSGPPGPLSVGALELPVPGGPEPVSFGACACKGGMGDVTTTDVIWYGSGPAMVALGFAFKSNVLKGIGILSAVISVLKKPPAR